jgi:hypothetical protein
MEKAVPPEEENYRRLLIAWNYWPNVKAVPTAFSGIWRTKDLIQSVCRLPSAAAISNLSVSAWFTRSGKANREARLGRRVALARRC